jgi:hypothetical protein
MRKTLILGVLGALVGLLAACDSSDDDGTPGGVITHEAGVINGGVWALGTHVLLGSVSIEGGVLTVAPCSVIKVAEDSSITVRNGGALKLLGTADCPITLTSSKDLPAPGDWRYIEFYDSAEDANNVFEHVVVEYGGGANYGAIWLDNDASIAVTNTSVKLSADYGIQLERGAHLRAFTGNTINANAKAPVALYADSVDDLGAGIYTPNTIEGIEVWDAVVSHDATWLALGVPYVAPNGFDVSTENGSAKLTLAAGVELRLGASAVVGVSTNGGLTLAGTTDAHVVVTSAKGTPSAGDWGQIEFYSDSNDAENVFSFADIMYGGGNDYGQVWLDEDASVALEDVTFSNAKDAACDIDNATSSTITEQGTNTYAICP